MDSRAPSIDQPNRRPPKLEVGHAETVRASYWWRLTAQMGWIVLAVVSVSLFFASLPAYVSDVREVCTGSDCAPLSMTPESAAALADIGLSTSQYAAYLTSLAVIFAVTCYAVSFLIFLSRPGDVVAWFASLMLIVFGTTFPQTIYALGDSTYIGRLVYGTESLGVICLIAFFFVFPDGRFIPRWTKWFLIAATALVVTRLITPDSLFAWGNLPPLIRLVETLLLATAALFALSYRYFRISDREQRKQTKWVISGIAGALIGLIIVVIAEDMLAVTPIGSPADLAKNLFIIASFLLIPISLGIAILRHQLWDIDLIINRALVYGTLTLLVVGTYIVIVAYLGTVLQTDGDLLISLVATGIVAVLFQPVRERVQRGVNRLIYGERDEPYGVITRFGKRLEETPAPDAVLPMVVKTVADTLKLPYVAITLRHGEEFALAAANGEPISDPLRLPLVYHGQTFGELLLAHRIGERAFNEADLRLLDDLSRQVGIAARAVRLTEDLQRSREQLVAAREEERRRLRRDLHDGLGPQLASQTLALDAAIQLLEDDPHAVSELLHHLKNQSKAAVADIRRLVYELRPPALDDLGLVAALRDYADRYVYTDLDIRVDALDSLPELPAAIEVAAYRIVQEALANVSRHARAHTCRVSLTVKPGTLVLEIRDDGVGLPSDYTAGVGLVSMRERAEESGGTLTIESAPGSGTQITARLPLPLSEEDQ